MMSFTKMKLCAECAFQQLIQIIANNFEARKSQALTPITIGRLKNKFNDNDGKTHLEILTRMFAPYTDDSYIIVDRGGYIAVVPPGGILASRIRITYYL